jgi:dTMP kinase
MSTISGAREGYRGLFVIFEGIDGSGKTTQIRRFVDRLRAAGRTVVETVEPGGTPIGVQIRRVLLDPENHELSPTAELLLYFASRAQNVDQLIRPALDRGDIVVCDRFTDSTIVYQGAGRGLGKDVVGELHRIACGTLQPDITVYLDIDLETSLERAHARNREQTHLRESRLEQESVQFHEAVREAYLALAAAEPRRFRVIDARHDPDAIERAIWSGVQPLPEARPEGGNVR